MIESESEFLMEVTNKTKGDLKASIVPISCLLFSRSPSIKGGTLVDYDGSLRLLELGQVPLKNVDDFKSSKYTNTRYRVPCTPLLAQQFLVVFNFRILNTNNLWINLKGASVQAFCQEIFQFIFNPALKRVLDKEGLDLDIIEKHRYLDHGKPVIQVKSSVS